MLGLTLHNPWPWSIFDPIADKGIENRGWPAPLSLIGQTIAIHAGLEFNEERKYRIAGATEPLSAVGVFLAYKLTHAPMRKEQYPKGVIVGLATIERCVGDDTTLPDHQKRWFFGPYGFVLANRRKLPTPILHKGKQGLWKVSPQAQAEIDRQLGN